MATARCVLCVCSACRAVREDAHGKRGEPCWTRGLTMLVARPTAAGPGQDEYHVECAVHARAALQVMATVLAAGGAVDHEGRAFRAALGVAVEDNKTGSSVEIELEHCDDAVAALEGLLLVVANHVSAMEQFQVCLRLEQVTLRPKGSEWVRIPATAAEGRDPGPLRWERAGRMATLVAGTHGQHLRAAMWS